MGDGPTTGEGAERVHSEAVTSDVTRRGGGVQYGGQPGDWIGPYKLLELLGEGGFGAVWLAEQTHPVRRRIALKVIKPGMDSKAVIARFEAERQALAMMSHPCVAKVLDAGTTDHGLPFFVMEHVKGPPITAYCDQHRLTIERRLALFIQVCDAVQHAHMKGIIHRDLKPSNILVTVAESGEARPVVIDFGVAKALAGRLSEQTIYTERGQLIGTPEYMSPEQAEMAETDIDTRSDVYSLGAILYELLTGAVPFDSRSLRSAGVSAIQKMIREQDPPRPSTRLSTLGKENVAAAEARQTQIESLASTLKRELEWIPLKALRKDRTERYRSASQLADDVRNYLAHRPLIAGPESAAYKTRKFVRRNKALVVAAGVIAASLVVATGVSVWFGVSESRQRGIAEANAAAETKARKRAEAINAFLTRFLQSSDPITGGKRDTTVAEALGQLVNEIESGALKDDPETEAGLKETVGIILQNNGRYAEAQPLLEQALAIRERLYTDGDERVAATLNSLAGLYSAQGRYAQAEPLFRRSLSMNEKLVGPDHPLVATGLNNLAELFRLQGQFTQAEPLYTRSLKIREKALGADHSDVAESLHNLAHLYSMQGQLAKAEPLLIRSVAIKEKILGPDHPHLAASLNNLGFLYASLGDSARAEAIWTRSLAIIEKALGPDHSDVAFGLNNLALLYAGRGDYARAEPLNKRALAIWEKALGADHPNVALGLNNLAFLYDAQGRYAEAEPLYRRALAIREKSLGPDHPDVAVCLTNLARTHQALGRTAEARQGFDQAVALLRRLSPDGSSTLARVLWRSGCARLESDGPGPALPELEAAAAMAEKVLPSEHPQLKEYRETLTKCRQAQSASEQPR